MITYAKGNMLAAITGALGACSPGVSASLRAQTTINPNSPVELFKQEFIRIWLTGA